MDYRGHYFEQDIEALRQIGLLVGDSQGNVQPDSFLTVGRFAAVLNRFIKHTEKNAWRYVQNQIQRVINQSKPAVVRIACSAGIGTGSIVTPQGHIVTNLHCISNDKQTVVSPIIAQVVKGSLDNSWEIYDNYPCEVLVIDATSDLAILKIPGTFPTIPLHPGPFDNDIEGKMVIAMGYPLGAQPSASFGIVCQDSQITGMVGRIQTDAAINPGNSGGPLLDLQGRMIGVNTLKVVGPEIDNIGYAGSVYFVRTLLQRAGVIS